MLHWLDYVVFAVYLLATAAVGSAFFQRKSDLQGYLQAGHQMHWSVVAISIIAALFSGISYLSAPSETYHHNLVYTWQLAAYFIATPIAAYLFLPFYFKLKLFSAYEYLEARFDLRVRTITSALFIFRTCVWLALAIYAPSLVLAEMVGLPMWISVVIIGLGTTAYTTLGGMRAVIWTEVLQFFVLLAGVVVIMLVAAGQVPGGLGGAWNLAAAEGRTELFDLRVDPTVRMTLWGALIGGIPLVLYEIAANQMAVQRYMTTPSLRAGQRALWVQMLLTVPMCIVFYLTGTVLFGFYQANPERLPMLGLEQADRIFPYFVIHELPTPMPGLLVAAVFAATMSTISGGLNALATATLIDFFVRLGGRNESDPKSVRTARLLTVAFGVLTTALAMVVGQLGTLIEVIGLLGGVVGGPILGIFLLALLSRRANGIGALCGAAAGVIVVLLVASHVSFNWHALISTSVTFAFGAAASLLFPAPSADQQRRFVYSGSKRSPASDASSLPSAV